MLFHETNQPTTVPLKYYKNTTKPDTFFPSTIKWFGDSECLTDIDLNFISGLNSMGANYFLYVRISWNILFCLCIWSYRYHHWKCTLRAIRKCSLSISIRSIQSQTIWLTLNTFRFKTMKLFVCGESYHGSYCQKIQIFTFFGQFVQPHTMTMSGNHEQHKKSLFLSATGECQFPFANGK